MDDLVKRWRYIEEEDKYYCDGDCWSWSFGVCTCGLYSELRYRNQLDKLAHWDNVKHRQQSDVYDFLLHNAPKKVTECHHGLHLNETCERCHEEADAILKEIFEQDQG